MPDRIISQPANDTYRANWERIWGGPGTVNHPSHEWPNGYPRYTEATCPVCKERREAALRRALPEYGQYEDCGVSREEIQFAALQYMLRNVEPSPNAQIVNLEVPK